MNIDIPISEFLTTVRNEPLPGGGSVIALAGALSASLLGKVCRLTSGREPFLEFEEQTQKIWRECKLLDNIFVELMQEDALSYQSVVNAYRMPQISKENIEQRRSVLETAWQNAVESPVRIAEKSLEVIKLSGKLVGKSNRVAVADIGVAANMAYGAAEGAVIIVKDNLTKVKNVDYVLEKIKWCEKLLNDAASQWGEIKSNLNDICACML